MSSPEFNALLGADKCKPYAATADNPKALCISLLHDQRNDWWVTCVDALSLWQLLNSGLHQTPTIAFQYWERRVF